jgi:hypothetical protein
MVDQGPDENERPAGWDKVDLDWLIPPGEEALPFTLIANRFTSSTDESEDFIHDPLRVLIEAQWSLDPPLDFVIDEEWTVTTFIVNHHQTLQARHLYATAALKSDEKTAGVTIVKKKPDTNGS